MRTWVVIAFLLFTALAGAQRNQEALDALKSRVDSARPEDRPGLCLEVAQRQLEAADQLYGDGKTDPARAAVQDVVKYAEQARDASLKSGKALKHTEISVRKMAMKLRDIRRSLSFEDQPPVQAAAQRLEDVRTDLLVHMFGKQKK
jgi:hypothetical protein